MLADECRGGSTSARSRGPAALPRVRAAWRARDPRRQHPRGERAPRPLGVAAGASDSRPRRPTLEIADGVGVCGLLGGMVGARRRSAVHRRRRGSRTARWRRAVTLGPRVTRERTTSRRLVVDRRRPGPSARAATCRFRSPRVRRELPVRLTWVVPGSPPRCASVTKGRNSSARPRRNRTARSAAHATMAAIDQPRRRLGSVSRRASRR